MAGFMDVDQSETTFENVRHKKMTGHLKLSRIRMIFRCSSGETVYEWRNVAKHQVSPITHPKSMLKLVLLDNSTATFQFVDRPSLEKVRNDITEFLQAFRIPDPAPGATGKKRKLAEMSAAKSFEDLEPTALAVARSTVLSAHPSLRQQHQYLVEESKTVSEDDFWRAHEGLLGEEYARMSGLTKAGSSSILQSHVPASGRVTLGVEEMRQIFILYPAVHKAYEEKVPLELSDEQFWRKYLESEYFHRDRGRMGTAAKNHAGGASNAKNDSNKKGKSSGPSVEEQDARAAAVGADDLFSRYEQKLQEGKAEDGVEGGHRRWGTRLAVGQFDLAKTLETERGNLLAGPRDNHPPNQADDGKGSRVVEKYNRHWAMVLHPDEAVAGADLLAIARKSAKETLEDDEDAKPGGGVNAEMLRLVEFASAGVEEVDHASGQGIEATDYELLTLNNIVAYHSGQLSESSAGVSEEEKAKRHKVFANMMVIETKNILQKVTEREGMGVLPTTCFPEPVLGRQLLRALTQKMEADSRTEAESMEMVNQLPEDFREKLQSYFRRSSELLRHFFGLRRLEEQRGSAASSQKLGGIVAAMQNFYREMEGMRKDLPQGGTGEDMRKMCLPIMDQLDWAFQKHNEGSGGGRGGGFVDVE
mmetsp:Transcript_8816/g.16850  ORF Transcript_8816/g.16850 Transcript_8816/m.16850 type:complete len:645 (-) Transcript_8816:171-2105(-)